MADDWIESRWGDIATLEYGKGLRGYKGGRGQYPVYGTNGQIGWHTEPLCGRAGVIVGRKGAYRGVHYSKTPFYVIDTAFYVEPKTDFDMKWAYYYLLTQDINSMDSGSAIPSTSREDFYSLPVLVPPIAEQKAIACVLGTLDDKIELNRQMNQTLEAIASAIFRSWFVDFDPVWAKMDGEQPYSMDAESTGLFPEVFTDSSLGQIPRDWHAGTVGEDFNITMGQSPAGKTYNEDGDGSPFYQGRRDFGFRYPSVRVYCSAPTRFAKAGDTLVSVRAPVGDVNMAIQDCSIGRGVAAIRHKTGSCSYTYYAMRSLRPLLDRFEAEGTVFGSLNKRDFHKLPFLIPPVEIVKDFEKKVFPLDEMIEMNEKQSQILAALRDTLLPKLIYGHLRLPDAEKDIWQT